MNVVSRHSALAERDELALASGNQGSLLSGTLASNVGSALPGDKRARIEPAKDAVVLRG